MEEEGKAYLVVVSVRDDIVGRGLSEFDGVLLAVGVVRGAAVLVEVASLYHICQWSLNIHRNRR